MTARTARLALSLCLALGLLAGSVRAECPSHPADLAPGVLGDEMPTPTWTVLGDGAINVQDVLALLQAAVTSQVLAWEEPASEDCPMVPGDIAPGSEDGMTYSPDMLDGAVNVSDVIIALRLAVNLIAVDPAYIRPVVGDARAGDRVVAGDVVDSVNGAGLPGVTVSAFSSETPVGSVQTDGDGAFLLQGLPGGDLRLLVDGTTSTAAAGKFSTLQVVITSDTEGTTTLRSITLADEEDPSGVTDKFMADETGTVDMEIDLSNSDGDVGLSSGPGGKIENDDGPVDGEVDLSVSPLDGEELPEELSDEDSGDDLNGTGAVAVSPADGKFTAGSGFAARQKGAIAAGFDLTLPNRKNFPVGTTTEIWRWQGADGRWVNHTFETGFSGTVIDLGDGMSAVFAAGAATQGGIYAASKALDFGCTIALTARVVDQFGTPLPGVFVDSDLGVYTQTGPDGSFFIDYFPAYSGVDIGDCVGIGFDLTLRGGLSLGGSQAVVSVDAMDVFPGDFLDLLDLELSVPDDACLSGLVLKNGVPQSGPVAIMGPENFVRMADAEGRFFASGLTPGEYTASFAFSGEAFERDFDFELFPRTCSTVRLEVNEGDGARRVEVHVFFDHDADLLTPGLPATGALVELKGTDTGSMGGLTSVVGPSGVAVFEGVDGPFHVLAQLDVPIPQEFPEPGVPAPFARLGASLTTNAMPTHRVGLMLVPPGELDDTYEPPPGFMSGTISNLPPTDFDFAFVPSLLRRGHWDFTGFDGSIFAGTGEYTAGALTTPYDLMVGHYDQTFIPYLPLEFGFFGPFQVPEPAFQGDIPELMEDLDYGSIQPLAFASPLDLSFTGFLTSSNIKLVDLLGRAAAGRQFVTGLAESASIGPPPSSLWVPDPASPGGAPWDLFLEVASEAYAYEFSSQFCLVPLPSPLPMTLPVDFLNPPDINGWSMDPSATVAEALSTPIQFDTPGSTPPNGYDALSYFVGQTATPPGEPEVSFFVVYLPSSLLQQAVLPPTPWPVLFEDREFVVGVQSIRGLGLPAEFETLFDDKINEHFLAILDATTPVCSSDSNELTYLAPELP